MDHVVYLDHRSKELKNLIYGKKSMIIRAASGRKIPYGKINAGDMLYFIENNGDGVVRAKAVVSNVFNSKKLNTEESVALVTKHKDELQLHKRMHKRVSGKRYIVLIKLKKFQEIEPFPIDISGFENMEDWLPVEDINSVTIQDKAELT